MFVEYQFVVICSHVQAPGCNTQNERWHQHVRGGILLHFWASDEVVRIQYLKKTSYAQLFLTKLKKRVEEIKKLKLDPRSVSGAYLRPPIDYTSASRDAFNARRALARAGTRWDSVVCIGQVLY